MPDKQPNKIQLRFKELRTEMNLNQVEFADITKINQSHISAIERGVKNITPGILLTLEDTIGANRRWLESGEGDKFISKTTQSDKVSVNSTLKNITISQQNNLESIPESGTLVSPKPKTMLILEEEPKNLRELSPIIAPQKAIPFFTNEFYMVLHNEVIYNHTDHWTSNPVYAGCDAVVRHYGEGMAPVIGDGYLMGIKHIDKNMYFPQGSIYKLITAGFNLTRYVHKSERENYFTISGANNQNPKEEIHKDEILSMWHVKVSIPYGTPKYY